MNILVIYATVEGQTGKIARFVAQEAEALGHKVTLEDADTAAELPIRRADAVILAAPVHQRRHPRNFEALLIAQADELKEKKTLMLSVSLNAAFPEGCEEAEEYLQEMNLRTGLDATQSLLVGGAIRTLHYDYFAMQVIRHVVMRNRTFDASETEHEFTDWQALSKGVAQFLGESG